MNTNASSNSGASKRYASLTKGSSGLGQQATPGSNKAQWNAMDLHIGSGGGGGVYGARSGGANAAAMKVDDSGLSARNIMMRRMLMERKRFDSADHAMQKHEEAGAAQAMTDSTSASSPAFAQKNYTPSRAMASGASAPFSPAQVGASVFYSALGGNDSDENVNMDAQMDPGAGQADAAGDKGGSSAKSYAMQAMAAAAARSASRYGNLPGPQGGAESGRNILLQKKLREKKHFDSADYQLAQIKPSSAAAAAPGSGVVTPSSSTDSSSSSGGEHGGATPMEIDLTPAADPVENINSPSAASVAHRSRVDAQMSPSVRGGKYGGGMSGANVLVMRKLSQKKRFDSADYQMAAAPVAAQARQSFFVTAPSASPPAPPVAGAASAVSSAVTAPPAPHAVSSSSGGGGSKYGKLSAANVLIRKKLKERKRFDSADYAMEKLGRRQPPNGGQGGSSGALQGGHVVMGTPMTHHNVHMEAAFPAEENKSISHQVKHIKLSEEGGGWATRVPAGSASGSSTFGSAMPKAGDAMASQDHRLVARNIIFQRKLSERKRFDSADYFKEAAGRGKR